MFPFVRLLNRWNSTYDFILFPIEISFSPFQTNIPSIVNVRPERASSVFQAYIQTPQGNTNLPITVHKSAKSGYSHTPAVSQWFKKKIFLKKIMKFISNQLFVGIIGLM